MPDGHRGTTSRMIVVSENIRGLIFDLDGTLADTMPAHFRAWTETLDAFGVPFPEDFFYSLGGMPTPRIIELLNRQHGKQMPVEETSLAKEKLAGAMIRGVRPIEPVLAVARSHFNKLPMAVATGAYRSAAVQTLADIGATDLFPVLVCTEDVTHGKPAPDVFLEAARRIGVAAKHCLVFEDAELGIQAAKAAGMAYVDVRTI